LGRGAVAHGDGSLYYAPAMAEQQPRWIEYLPIDELARAPRNPKGHDARGIRQSIDRHGYTEPIMLDDRTERLISGHGRLDDLTERHAAGKQPPEGIVERDGRWLAPVVRGWSSANDLEAEAALIGANQLTIAGGWTEPQQLIEMLQAQHASPEASLAGTGYTPTTLDKLLSDAERAALGDITTTPRRRRPPRTDIDLLLTVGYRRPEYVGDPAVFHGAGAVGLCCVAIRFGWSYGTNSTHACCALADHWKMHRLAFLDNPYRDYDHAEHAAMVAEFRPKYATTRDAMSPEQCAAAGIEHYPIEQIIEWAEELDEHAEHVIVIPKYHEAVEQIPEKFVLGYSIPSSHGGTPLPTERFAGRPVHLLGGTPLTQYRYWQRLQDEVVSIDNNSVVRTSKMGVVYGPNGEAMKLPDFGVTRDVTNPLYIALVLSLGHIAYWYGKGWAPDIVEGEAELDAEHDAGVPESREVPVEEAVPA
jgi:hypothetical protein